MKDDHNGIEVYPNIYEKEYCDEIIKHFNIMARNKVTYNQNNLEVNQDNRIVFDWAHTQNQYHYDYNLCDYFYKKLHDTYTEQYMEKYQMLKQSEQHSPKGMSIQKTLPHQGYHAWHAEAADIGSCSRVMNYMLYLNDVEEGGETEFLYQGMKTKPVAGKLVFFPATWQHPHRGNPIYDGYKYIITGWFTYDE